jgi:hypothetical protein
MYAEENVQQHLGSVDVLDCNADFSAEFNAGLVDDNQSSFDLFVRVFVFRKADGAVFVLQHREIDHRVEYQETLTRDLQRGYESVDVFFTGGPGYSAGYFSGTAVTTVDDGDVDFTDHSWRSGESQKGPHLVCHNVAAVDIICRVHYYRKDHDDPWLHARKPRRANVSPDSFNVDFEMCESECGNETDSVLTIDTLLRVLQFEGGRWV